MKYILLLFLFSSFLFNSRIVAQINVNGAYLIGNNIEVGINNAGFEGTYTLAGSHSRSDQFDPAVFFGFVANPQLNAWATYDGDFFTPGTPENGFGIEINGINYSNNAIDANFGFGIQNEIPGTLSNYLVVGDCISVEWNGTINNVNVKIVYKMVTTDLFYTTEVTLTNNTGASLSNVYYYRNVDADNNVFLNTFYETTNTIDAQPTGGCPKALVSATQPIISGVQASYLGLAAIGPMFRVCTGGFTNRDGSDIWNGIGFNSAVGSSLYIDEAISLGYKITSLASGASETFKFATILAATQIDEAFSNLYEFDYPGVVLGSSSACSPTIDETTICGNAPSTISMVGPNVNDYTWAWSPAIGLNTSTGPVVQAFPNVPTTYTVTGTPVNPCLTLVIVKTIVVNPGIDIQITDPGPLCGDISLSSLTIVDLNNSPGTVMTFHGSIPASSTDMSNLWGSSTIGFGDIVYVMIASSTSNCFDIEQILLNFSGGTPAGPDVVATYCNTAGIINLNTLIPAGISITGTWIETSAATGQFTALSGDFDLTGLPDGAYTFSYTVPSSPPCVSQQATYTINIVSVANAGLDNAITVCNGSGAINLNTMLVGADAGGAWSETSTFNSGSFVPSTGLFNSNSVAPGIYTFQYLVNACAADFAVMTITVNFQPLSGLDSATTICNVIGSSLDLNNLLQFANIGGTWSETTVVPSGQFNTINGVFDAAGLAIGAYTFNYTQASNAPCPGNFALFTVNVTGTPDAGLDSTKTFCASAGGSINVNTLLNGAMPGGTWNENSIPLSGQFNATTGVFNFGSLASGTYTFEYVLAGSAVCPSDTAIITIVTITTPTITPLPNQVHCGNYILPAIIGTNLTGNEAYYSGINGTGTQFSPGDTITSTQTLYLYDATGTLPNCSNQQTVNIVINGAPVINFTASVTSGCAPLTVTFTNTTVGGTLNNCTWDFGPISQSNACTSFTYTYQNAGVYDVSLSGTSSSGCSVNLTLLDLIEVFPVPTAAFTLTPAITDIFDTTCVLTNQSTGADSYLWDFQDGTTSTSTDEIHLFPATPNAGYNITLIASTIHGCTDTVVHLFTVVDVILFYIPNTFTPDGDEYNNTFMPIYASGVDPYGFNMQIFNRWGEIVFETNDMTIGWDGTYGGVLVPDGSYVWTLEFKETMSDSRHSYNGNVNIFR